MRLLTGVLTENEDGSLTFVVEGANVAASFPVTNPATVLLLRDSENSPTETAWDVIYSAYQAPDTRIVLRPSITALPASVMRGVREIGMVGLTESVSADGSQYALIGIDVGYNPNASRRSVRLTRFEAENVNFYYFGAYRMRIEATEAQGPDMDPYVFIYRRGPLNPYTGEYCDEFMAVAGPADMAEIPALEPDPERSWPFFRLDYIEDDFRSSAIALEVWNIVETEVAVLVEAMGRLTQLKTVETQVVYGPELTENPTDSESAG